ncbi:capsid assembly scaffolding protein Gp46 family protein [Lactobacillus acetotolerans]|uniref:capsid assembly scaffolding protein Gp46 family protein n=1 Tax=Lactobacillus acetotolerans TaxID=1600 RepID=UPI002FD8C4BC
MAEQGENTLTLTKEELQAKLDSEADKRAAKAIETAKAKWEADQAEVIQKAKSEGERLAQLSADEKLEAERKAKLKEFEEREAALNKRELKANTSSLLSEANLPKKLADSLVELGDADKIKETTDLLAKTIEDEVNRRVKEQLRSDPPKNNPSALGNPEEDDPFQAKIKKYQK